MLNTETRLRWTIFHNQVPLNNLHRGVVPSVPSGNSLVTQKSKAQGNFHLKLHLGFHCPNWTVSSVWSDQSTAPLSCTFMQQRRLVKWQPSVFCLFCCQCFSWVASSVNSTCTLSGTCSWYKKINVITHQKLLYLYFISLAYTCICRVINPIRPKRAYAHP